MIGAVVLAAGRSLRMGRPKMTLPWGRTTVIGQVAKTLLMAGVSDVVVVTGGARIEVAGVLKDLPIRTVFVLHIILTPKFFKNPSKQT